MNSRSTRHRARCPRRQADSLRQRRRIDGGLTAEQRSKIASICLRFETCAGVDWLAPDVARLADLPARPRLPREVFLRLLMDELLPADLHRALWLDADVVVEASLAPLWNHPFGGTRSSPSRTTAGPRWAPPAAPRRRAASWG